MGRFLVIFFICLAIYVDQSYIAYAYIMASLPPRPIHFLDIVEYSIEYFFFWLESKVLSVEQQPIKRCKKCKSRNYGVVVRVQPPAFFKKGAGLFMSNSMRYDYRCKDCGHAWHEYEESE